MAARVESLAEAGGIGISGRAHDQVENKLGLEYEDLGKHEVKNISRPIQVYRVLSYPGAAAHRVVQAKETIGRKWRNIGILVAIVVVFIGGLAIWQFYMRRPQIEPASEEKMAYPLPEIPSIAVLAFDNLSGDPEQESFSDGIAEEIITALSKTPKIFVIARNSSFTYKGKPVKVQQVAEELGVRYVLEGSVRKADDKLRITAQLVDAITGKHLWAERYDRKLEDIFSIQDEITKKIITELQVKLTEGEHARVHAKGTDNLEAYLKIMQVFSLIAGKPENNALVRQLAEEAVALDPDWPLAYVALSISHTFEVWYGTSKNRAKSLEQAYEMGQKALALDEKCGPAHANLAIVYTLKKEFEKSIEHGKLSVELEPNSANYHASLARLLMNAGSPKESIPLYEKALRLDPYTRGNNYYNYGYALWMMGRYKEAIEAGKEARNRRPNDIFSYILLSITYIELGRDEQARASSTEVLRIKPDISLEWLAKMVPWKNKGDVDRLIGNLRKSGLPE
jgi:TolB-like protein/Tfp pilus assembly protein PilF